MPAHLKLIKSLSHLQEEQRCSDEILLDGFGLTFTRGTVVEIAGGASTGKTSIALGLLAKLTHASEICAVVDAAGGFDPRSAVLAGARLDNLLWVKCSGDVEKTFLAADCLVQAKGFGAIWLNLCGLRRDVLRMVPKTYWYRFRTRLKDTQTILIATSSEPVSSSASQSSFNVERERTEWSGSGKFKLLRTLDVKISTRKDYAQPNRARIEMDYTEV